MGNDRTENPPVGEIENKFTINNELGLHVRSAAVLVRTATRYQATVRLRSGGTSADAKSLLDLLILAATKASTVFVSATGDDAHEAVAAIGDLILRDFADS